MELLPKIIEEDVSIYPEQTTQPRSVRSAREDSKIEGLFATSSTKISGGQHKTQGVDNDSNISVKVNSNNSIHIRVTDSEKTHASLAKPDNVIPIGQANGSGALDIRVRSARRIRSELIITPTNRLGICTQDGLVYTKLVRNEVAANATNGMATLDDIKNYHQHSSNAISSRSDFQESIDKVTTTMSSLPLSVSAVHHDDREHTASIARDAERQMSRDMSASTVRYDELPNVARNEEDVDGKMSKAMSVSAVNHSYVLNVASGDGDNARTMSRDKSSTSSLDRNSPNQRLEDHIKLQHLQQIMQEFFQHNPDDELLVPQVPGYFSGKLRRRIPGSMNLEEFKDTIFRVLGTDEYDDYLEKLFIKLDTLSDGFVDWNEFCTHLLLLYRENDYLHTKCDLPFVEEAKIRHIVHNRQEQTSKIVAVHSPVRYVTISKEGAICVWHPSMTMDKHYVISDHVDDQKRRFKMWVTDAVYMRNCEKIAIGSTSRDIRFYDVSSSQYFEEYHLFALADVPYCCDYYYNPQQPNTESILIFGVDTGAIHLLTFLKPVTQLFETPFKNDGGVQKIYMQDIASHSTWVRHHVITAVHPDIIRQVRYLPDNEAIISASASPKSTIVICDIFGVKKSYVFRIEKGVECFDHNKNLNLLATGSGDHIVRLWNPYVTNSPIAILSGHLTGIIGLVLHERFKQVFSYSKDAVIKVWDTREHTCLQTISLKFPSSLHGRIPEHGQFPVHLQETPPGAFLVTCNDYLACLRLGRPEENTAHTESTHDTQLCCAIYNKLLKQVVTGCDSSTIAVWDIESGAKSFVFTNSHDGEEITCLTFDESYRRLISAARNGTVKVWNFHNGHHLHNLENVGDAEVTGLIHLADQKVILTVGWNQMILSYDDSNPENKHLPAKTSWKGGQLHKDDILTSDYAPPNFLATASYDGEIIIWEADTERVYLRLRKGKPTNISQKLDALKTRIEGTDGRPSTRSASRSRPNSRHRTSHKVEQGQTAPVDKLHFLKTRAAVRFTDSAVLISSQAGSLHWWSIYTVNKEIGCFYVPSIPDESVLAMCTTPDDSLLITGDTLGTVSCWDIRAYCLQFEGNIDNSTPPAAASWRAHDGAIVSVQYIEHDAGNLVLTASTDKTARLWTSQGHLIGTFGQRDPWHLTEPSTWVHPKTPWSVEESDDITEQTESTCTTHGEEPQEAHAVNEEETKSEDMQDINSAVTLSLDSREKSYISQIPTFLGFKAEQDLARRQRDRKDRRAMFGDISQPSTARFGKQCSPYHALTAPEWQDIEVPTHLPLSQRMQNLGYSGSNLTPDYIKSMDFSYGNIDMSLTRVHTPSITRGLTASLPKGLTSRHGSTSRLDKEDVLPPIRSNHLLQVHNQQ